MPTKILCNFSFFGAKNSNFFRKQTCSDAGCSIVAFLQGPSSCKKEISKPLSIDVVKDLKMDGNAVLINAVKGSSNKWLQLVGSNWEDIEAKVNQFTLDSSACANSATVCVLVWDGTKLRAVMYSTKEIEITITTNASPLAILMGGASSSTETKKVKIEGFCQVQGTAIPSGPQCNPVDCYPNAECINGQCICKAGFSLYNNLPSTKIHTGARLHFLFINLDQNQVNFGNFCVAILRSNYVIFARKLKYFTFLMFRF